MCSSPVSRTREFASVLLFFFFFCSLAALCTRQPAIKMDAWLIKKKKTAKDQANTANSQNTVPEGGQLENKLANVSKATSSETRLTLTQSLHVPYCVTAHTGK